MSVFNQQKKICRKFGLSYEVCDMDKYLYITSNIKEWNLPIEGKRYIEEWDFCGWYIWSWEKSNDKEDFDKVDLNNINEYSDTLIKFLWLERGTWFIIEEDYINAEFDYRIFNMIDQ
jgi:hypothetical protein